MLNWKDKAVKEQRKALEHWFGKKSKPLDLIKPKLSRDLCRFYDQLRKEKK